jgi:hypothetical protein
MTGEIGLIRFALLVRRSCSQPPPPCIVDLKGAGLLQAEERLPRRKHRTSRKNALVVITQSNVISITFSTIHFYVRGDRAKDAPINRRPIILPREIESDKGKKTLVSPLGVQLIC